MKVDYPATIIKLGAIIVEKSEDLAKTPFSDELLIEQSQTS